MASILVSFSGASAADPPAGRFTQQLQDSIIRGLEDLKVTVDTGCCDDSISRQNIMEKIDGLAEIIQACEPSPCKPDSIKCGPTPLNSERLSNLLSAVQWSIGLALGLIALASQASWKHIVIWLAGPMWGKGIRFVPTSQQFLVTSTIIVLILTLGEVVLLANPIMGVGCLPVWLYNGVYALAITVFLYASFGILRVLGKLTREKESEEKHTDVSQYAKPDRPSGDEQDE